MMGLFQVSGTAPARVQFISQTHSILALVGAGLGIAVVPEAAGLLRPDGVLLRPCRGRWRRRRNWCWPGGKTGKTLPPPPCWPCCGGNGRCCARGCRGRGGRGMNSPGPLLLSSSLGCGRRPTREPAGKRWGYGEFIPRSSPPRE
ncbi:hypothetical protein ACFQU7_17325 [Pseudoroseomonas wenyumeiae]